MERRYGIVYVSEQFALNHEEMWQIFAKLKAVVIRCEFYYDRMSFMYVLYSPFFDAVPLGEKIWEYTITIDEIRSEEGEVTDYAVSVERVRE